MGKNVFLTLVVCVCAFLSSCSSSEDFLVENVGNGVPKVLSTDIVFEAENGEKETNITRGIGPNGFTNVYPYDHIYIHSTTDNSKTLKVPLKQVDACGDCKGIHLEMEVIDGKDGYTIRTSEGESIELGEDEEVYFSSYPTTEWEANPLDVKTPVSQKDVFSKEEQVNMELLRSEETYDKTSLATLLQTPTPQIRLKRHCTGFMVSLMFTNVDEYGGPDQPNYSVVKATWSKYLEGTKPEDFYIKLYVGPNFCHSYDIYNNSVPEDDKGGYYVTHQNTYIPFEKSSYSSDPIIGEEDIQYSGFGYDTKEKDILLAPLNTSLDLSQFSIYVMVKYAPEGTDTSSDGGAAWIQVPIKSMDTSLNVIHRFVICLDINELKNVMNLTQKTQTTTRSYWERPIELKPEHPVIVKHYTE